MSGPPKEEGATPLPSRGESAAPLILSTGGTIPAAPTICNLPAEKLLAAATSSTVGETLSDEELAASDEIILRAMGFTIRVPAAPPAEKPPLRRPSVLRWTPLDSPRDTGLLEISTHGEETESHVVFYETA